MVYVLGEKPGVYAWGQPQKPRWDRIDKNRYRELIIRFIYQVLLSLGISERDLSSLVIGRAYQLELWPPDDPWQDFEEEASLADDLFGPYL
jgi:hypothetical protein